MFHQKSFEFMLYTYEGGAKVHLIGPFSAKIEPDNQIMYKNNTLFH